MAGLPPSRSAPRLALGLGLLLAVLAGLLALRPWAGGARGAGAAEDPRSAPPPDPPGPEAPAPPVQRIPAPGPARPALLELRVLEAAGDPAAGLEVLVHREGELLAHVSTGPDGAVRLDPLEEAAEALVFAGGAVLVRDRLPVGPAVRELRLPGAGALTGQVLVDGQPPGEPVRLVFRSLRGEPPWPLPAPALRALGFSPADSPVVGFETRTDGSFRLPGFAPDWEGRFVRAGPGLELEEGVEEPLPARADRFLRIRLRRRPALTGRVVAPEGEPAADAQVTWQFTCASGTAQGEVATDGEGRFRIPLSCGAVEKGRLEIHAPGAGFLALETGPVPPAGRDLGDLLLGPVRELEIIALDAEGRPLPGARAILGWRRSPPAGPDGRIRMVEVPAEAVSLEVHALAFQPRSLPLQPWPDGPLEAVLDRIPTLEVEVRGPGGEAVPGLVLVLEAGQAPFRGGQTSAEAWQVFLGAARTASARVLQGPEGGRARLFFETRQEPLVLPGLESGLPLRLLLEDRFGFLLEERALPPLGPREHRSVRLLLDRRPWSFELLVEDPDGRPLSKVRAEVLDAERPGLGWAEATDADGRLWIGPIHAPALDLRLRRQGFGEEVLLGLRPETVETPLRVVLSPGRKLEVEVVDAEGRPAEGARLRVLQGGVSVGEVQDQGSGRFQVEDLPPGSPVLLQAGLGTLVAETLAGSHQDRVQVRLPPAGRVRVQWPAGLPPGRPGLLEVLDPEGEAVYWVAQDTGDGGAGVRELGPVGPGRWRLRLRLPGEGGEEDRVWQAPEPVEVRAGETAEVVLEPLPGG